MNIQYAQHTHNTHMDVLEHHIFPFLGGPDLVNATYTCSEWYHVNCVNSVFIEFSRHWNPKMTLIKACAEGHFEIMKYLIYMGVDPYKPYPWYIRRKSNLILPFVLACRNGHLRIAQWLYTTTKVDFRLQNPFMYPAEEAFACNHLDVVKWLVTLPNIQYRGGSFDPEIMYVESCENGQLAFVQWLHSLMPSWLAKGAGLTSALVHGQIDVVEWIFAQDPKANITYIQHWFTRHPDVFTDICRNGYLEAAKWVFPYIKVDVPEVHGIIADLQVYEEERDTEMSFVYPEILRWLEIHLEPSDSI